MSSTLRRLIMFLLLAIGVSVAPTRSQANAPIVSDVPLGPSTEGRAITAVRVGQGPRKLVLVGATHGAAEVNTYELVLRLVDHFRLNPGDVPENVSLYLIPALNPDGLAIGTRLNARQVDLNRNMDTSVDPCPENDWRKLVAGAYGVPSDTGGAYPESEVESRLIRDFLLDAGAAIFFHSNAGVVFPACQHAPSTQLGQVFADNAGYVFIPVWDRYVITGGMHDWAGGLGIAAITPELVTGHLPEFEQNLAGVLAVLREADTLVPEPESRAIDGVAVHPVIWRAWAAWGGERLWGRPVAPPEADGKGGWQQLFDNGLLQYHPDRSDSTQVVQIGLLGQEWLGTRKVATEEPGPGRFFPETGHNIDGLFAQFWQIYGGLPIFGFPLTAEEAAMDERGQAIVTQTFERLVLTRPADATTIAEIRLRPLGRLRWAQADARLPRSAVRPR